MFICLFVLFLDGVGELSYSITLSQMQDKSLLDELSGEKLGEKMKRWTEAHCHVLQILSLVSNINFVTNPFDQIVETVSKRKMITD